MDPSKWLAWLRLPTRILAALCIVLGILIFSGDAMLATFGLKEFVQEYRAYLGVGFLLTLALTVVNSLAAVWTFIYPRIAEAFWIRLHRKRLHRLNPTEKKILRYYIDNQTRSQSLRVQDGTVNALQRETIIIRGSNIGTASGFDFIIQPWAWEYLNERPELLD